MKGMTIVLVVLASLGMAGCGYKMGHGPQAQASATVAAGVTASPTPSPEPEPAVQGDRLAAPYSYSGGFVHFGPPQDSYVPVVSAADALSAFEKTGLYSNELAGKTPTEFLASYTSYEGSEAVTASGQLMPNIDQQPAWVIRYENVPDTSSGTGGLVGSPGAGTVVFLHDIVAIVDADTGVVEEVNSDVPDQVAQGPPQAHPQKNTSS
jgi:hypothetical protein